MAQRLVVAVKSGVTMASFFKFLLYFVNSMVTLCEVLVTVPNPKKLRPVQALEKGKIRRIRGVAYSTRVSPQTPGRMVEAARGVLNQFLPDIFIFADVATGSQTGKSPG